MAAIISGKSICCLNNSHFGKMESEPVEDPMEALLQRHKKERKELQGKIQSLKKTATKGDKKKKKEVQEEITKLEQELTEKQNGEVEKLKAEEGEKSKESELMRGIEDVGIEEKPCTRTTKAQKRRDKRAAVQREREKRIQEQEVENERGARNLEMQKINEKLKSMGLAIYDVQADGNCLYNAVDHQLGASQGAKKLRQETGKHIRENSSDYLPFLSNTNTGEMLSEKEFDEYCNNIVNTTNWGGQVELRALSHVVKKPITVIQADGPPLIMGEEYKSNSESLIVTYHRHIYQLGEHYNSVQPFAEDESS